MVIIQHISSSDNNNNDNDSGDQDQNRSEEGDGEGEDNPEDGEVASSLLSMGGITAMQHVTRAPSRFSQASFIRELETIGEREGLHLGV